MTTALYVWDVVKREAEKHSRGLNPNGLAFWKSIRPVLEKYDAEHRKLGVTWESSPDKIGEFMQLTEFDDNDALIEVNHFRRQLAAITQKKDNENATLRTFAQIALNVGQFEGTVARDEWAKCGYEEWMSNPSNYLNDDSIKLISVDLNVVCDIYRAIIGFYTADTNTP